MALLTALRFVEVTVDSRTRNSQTLHQLMQPMARPALLLLPPLRRVLRSASYCGEEGGVAGEGRGRGGVGEGGGSGAGRQAGSVMRMSSNLIGI